MPVVEIVEPVETDRLCLCPFVTGDYEALHTMRSNPEVARYLYWDVQTPQETREAHEKKIANTAIRPRHEGVVEHACCAPRNPRVISSATDGMGRSET